MKISQEGKRHLGSAIGTRSFVENYVEEKVSTWKEELERLSDIAMSQPQAAYAAFTYGFKSKWTYLARTTPNIDILLEPLEEVLCGCLTKNHAERFRLKIRVFSEE